MDEKEIEALAHRMAWRYAKSHDPHHSDTYTFNRDCLLQFVEACLSAERQRFLTLLNDSVRSTWREAVAEESRKYLPLVNSVEDILEDGHMNTEHLSRLRSGYLHVMDGSEERSPAANCEIAP